ncbi:MAG: hypothetical protein MUC48_07660 [Leptolyngbya sp. Prado105]|jgi:hypothetical protein|nr:hypothetical protein [Leptolyngbya sp. Prado105]
MAFSGLTSRSRLQESPTLWLSVLGGSLALHLVVLLVGRWYLSQPMSSRAGGSQAPLDFVEIDPNAPPLKRSISPSSTATENAPVPKAAPESANPKQSASIEQFNRQVRAERSQPEISSKSEPIKQTKPDLRSDRLPRSPETTPNSDRSTRPPSSSNNPTTPKQNSPEDSAPKPNQPSSPEMNSTDSTKPNTSDPTQPNSTDPGKVEKNDPGDPNNVVDPKNPLIRGLSGSAFQGQIVGALEEDPNQRQKEGSLEVKLKNNSLQGITLDAPIPVPSKTLDLKVGMSIDPQGRVIDAVVRYSESATQIDDPVVREQIQGAVQQALYSSNDLFDVQLEVNTNPEQLSFRIARIQFQVVK